ncbi:MAG: PAS domain S-box protein [Gemmatimonadota bacterium]
MPASWFDPGSLVWFIVSHLAMSGCTLGVLTLRRRFGVGSIWLWVGALTVLMYVSSGAGWYVMGPSVHTPAGSNYLIGSGLIAPALIMVMLLVHVHHGAGDARRVLAGVVASSFIYQLFQELAGIQGTLTFPVPSWRLVLASNVSFAAVLAIMTGTYYLLNRFKLPLPLRFGSTLLLGIAVDSAVFPMLGFGSFSSIPIGAPDFIFSKVIAAITLTLPVALYLQREVRFGRKMLLQDMGAMAIGGPGTDGPVPTFAVWRAMAETLGDGMTAMVDDRIIFANAAMARIAGYSRSEDMTGLAMASIVVAEDLPRLMSEQGGKVGSAGHRAFEWRLRQPNGQVRILATTATPAYMGSGRVTIAIHRDVTLDRETREQLEASNLAVHALMAGASTLVASLKPEEIIGLVSEQACRLVGAEFAVFLERIPGSDRLVCREVIGAAIGILANEEIARDDATHFGRLPKSGARHSIPVMADGVELGLLVVSLREDGRQFTWGELALLDALVSMGAAALRTSRLVRELTDAEQRYATLFDHVPAPVWLYDLDTLRIHSVNQAAIRRYGYDREEFLALTIPDLCSVGTRDAAAAGARRTGAFNVPSVLQRHRDKAGEEFDVLMNASVVEIGTAHWGLAACADLTLEQRNQERQQTSLRLESLGRLAGGIAHDFNNILTALRIDIDLLVADNRENPLLQGELVHVSGAVERAADLTRQILLFSRGEETKRHPLYLNDSVRGIERLLTRSLGKTVELVLSLSPDNPMIAADTAQLHFALVNLCLNSRDAMPRGGVLTVSTEQQQLEESTAQRLGISSRNVAVLTVTDTGEGMPSSVLSRALEPFYTTKRSDRGTGLGLSIVHGVVTAHDGVVELESEVGVGTRAVLYFPLLETGDVPRDRTVPSGLRGSETVLLVDDEAGVRRAGQKMLQRYGYRVILAEDGEDALRRLEEQIEDIDLVVTDMVMPRMDARGLVAVIRTRWPEMPVLLSTGYDDGRLTEGDIERFDRLVPKPYTMDELLGAIRETLDLVPQ